MSWIIELEPGVWSGLFAGKPGRTYLRGMARQYSRQQDARCGLTWCRKVHPFPDAKIYKMENDLYLDDHKRPELIYLGCPYSHEDIHVRIHRFRTATKAAARLMIAGVHVFSPITHCHPMAMEALGKLPSDWEFWESYDRKLLEMSSKMLVLTLYGWKESVGLQAEIKIAEELDIQVYYRESDVMP